MSTTCIACGESLAPAARFCAFCGTPRAEAGSVNPSAQTTAMPTIPAPPVTGSSWATNPTPPGPGPGVAAREALFKSLDPATILVFVAAALAFGLPQFVYAYANPRNGYYGGHVAQAMLVLLLLVTIALAALGGFAAWKRLDSGGDERTAARIVFGIGIFAAVYAALEMLAVFGR